MVETSDDIRMLRPEHVLPHRQIAPIERFRLKVFPFPHASINSLGQNDKVVDAKTINDLKV